MVMMINIDISHNFIAKGLAMFRKNVYWKEINKSKMKCDGNVFYACQLATTNTYYVCFFCSGCRNYMTRDKSIFLDIDKSISSQEKTWNKALNNKGNGMIGIQTKIGTKLIQKFCLCPTKSKKLTVCFNSYNMVIRSTFKNDGALLLQRQKW